MHDTRSVLAWLDDPDTLHGVRFATDGDGWDTWTYAQLAQAARRVAAGLKAAGVGQDDVVSIVLPSGPHFVATLFGTMVAGGTPSPIAPPLAFQDRAAYGEHVAGLLRTSRPRVLVTNDALAGDIAECAGPTAAPGIATVAELLQAADDLVPGPRASWRYCSSPRGRAAALEAFASRSPRWTRTSAPFAGGCG